MGKRLPVRDRGRSRYGLLHQGSLVAGVSPDLLAPALGRHLAQRVNPWCPELSLGPDFFQRGGSAGSKEVCLRCVAHEKVGYGLHFRIIRRGRGAIRIIFIFLVGISFLSSLRSIFRMNLLGFHSLI